MTREPLAVLLVLRPILAPLPAASGESIVCWPGHPTCALVAVKKNGQVRAHCGLEDGKLYGAILNLLLDESVTPLTRADADALLRAS
jgi:hypothetical protein